ncbi:MAG: hypothetical protein JW873_05150 [Candidatus Saganbacteria bacterium]|nr:hypothetical protein [Candidatus Saganbacteria bacterium]
MKNFALEIRTPEKELFLGRVTALTVPASEGSLGVLAGHAPLAAGLKAGELVYRDEEGKEARLSVSEGFLIVNHQAVSVLLKG